MYLNDKRVMKCVIVATALIVIVATTPEVALAQTTLHTIIFLVSVHIFCDDVICPNVQDYHYKVRILQSPAGTQVSPSSFVGTPLTHPQLLNFVVHCPSRLDECVTSYEMTQTGPPHFIIETDTQSHPEEACHVVHIPDNITTIIFGHIFPRTAPVCEIFIHVRGTSSPLATSGGGDMDDNAGDTP